MVVVSKELIMRTVADHRNYSPTSKSVAIVQSNYIPWKGYFDLIAAVDEFVIYDDMQYTRRDWRNRNQIKTPSGPQWLTVPVMVKGRYYQSIRETQIDRTAWAKKHWRAMIQNYGQAPFFAEISSWLAPIYMQGQHTHLSTLNQCLIQKICDYLGIATVIRNSAEFSLKGDRSEKLLGIARALEATCYKSGPSAKAYLDTTIFELAGITVEWFDYSGYPTYPQQWGPFEHHVSIVDLLFQCGPSASKYMKYGHG
jgi:hypothetical protein